VGVVAVQVRLARQKLIREATRKITQKSPARLLIEIAEKCIIFARGELKKSD